MYNYGGTVDGLRPASVAAAVCAAAALVAGCNDTKTASAPTTPTQAKPAGVVMPDLRGSDIGAARRKLHALRLHAEVRGRYSSQDAGRVLQTDPASGARVTPGGQVALVVSRGSKPQPSQPVTTTPSSSAPTGSGCPAGQYTAPDGTCQPIPQSYGGSPPANSPEGQRNRQKNPDCKGLPPPPPDYKGPVQC